jgi:hypothetical protein
MKTEVKIAAAHGFVRSLNILLKFARLYDFGHPRTAAQFETAWEELRAALSTEREAGLLLAASGNQLLVDGVPLESGVTEQSFARLLSAAGISSIHFSPQLTKADLACLVRAFPTSGTNPKALTEQLKAALGGQSAIHVNEVCFVPADSGAVHAHAIAQLTASALGVGADEYNSWFDDPQKLLELVVAAGGAKGGVGGPGGGGSRENQPGERGSGGGGSGGTGFSGGNQAPKASPVSSWLSASAALRTASTSGSSRAGWSEPGLIVAGSGLLEQIRESQEHEEDVHTILRLLAQLAKTKGNAAESLEPVAFQQRLSTLPMRAQFTLRQALAALASCAPANQLDQPLLLRLAEHLAIQFALDSHERGDTRVDAVREMLERMALEVENLRQILGAHEAKMARAGILTQSYSEILSQKFWAQVSEDRRRAALLSPEAWCIPPGNVRRSIEESQQRGEIQAAEQILRNYAAGIHSPNVEARRRTAIGLTELVDLYAGGDGGLLAATLREVGEQLNVEHEAELQSLIGAAFARMTHKAANSHCFPAMQQAVESLGEVEKQRPALAESLRPRVGVENRLAEFIEEALRRGQVPEGLVSLLHELPGPAAEHLTVWFSRCDFREESDLVLDMVRSLGPEALVHLQEMLRTGNAAQAVMTVGLLSHLDAEALEELLPGRLQGWQRSAHDRVVRQLAAGGAPERGRLLLAAFDSLDPLVQPLAVDEIGLSGDPSTAPLLLRLGEGDLPEGSTPYLRLKALEALGRLRVPAAEAILQAILEERQIWGWANPSELRIEAAQALKKIDPDWSTHFLPRSGLDPAEMALAPLELDPHSPCIRQRRYARLRLAKPVPGAITNLRENCPVEVEVMNLTGGAANWDERISQGTLVSLRLNLGFRTVRVQAFVRGTHGESKAFEVTDIDLDERAKLRRLLVQLGGQQQPDSPEKRSRLSTPVVLAQN